MVKVVPVDAPDRSQMRRIGFMSGACEVPDDFDRMGEDEIAPLFGAAP
jgi:hypothetical protein